MGAAPVKRKSIFRCQACGQEEPRWLGRCPGCQEWNTLVEELSQGKAVKAIAQAASPYLISGNPPTKLSQIRLEDDAVRLKTNISEVDRVLGGGVIPGSLILLGGDPGIGKSTLLCQILSGLCEQGHSVLYVSGEESLAQIAMRAKRVGAGDNLTFFSETLVENILDEAKRMKPSVLALDSIQTMFAADLGSIPGSLSQVREVTARLMGFAKQQKIAIFVVGHVTKDGSLAGPKTLEHMVDVVLQFECEPGKPYRIVRAHKNRFGSTHEVGIFEMVESGLREVTNPSQTFLAERPVGVPGSVVAVSAEGNRPILVEVQALVAPAAFGTGRRTCVGIDSNRVSLLLAVLAERAGLDALGRDVFVNVAGGIRLTEPAADLAVVCALASAARNRPIDAHTAVFGEVGLGGEIRAVHLPQARILETGKLGFKRCILPAQNRKDVDQGGGPKSTVELVYVSRVAEALDAIS